MHSLRVEKNQVLTLKKSRERLYLATCVALPIIFISYHLGGHYSWTKFQVACTSPAQHQHNQHQHHHHHHQHHHHQHIHDSNYKRPHILNDIKWSSYAHEDEKTFQKAGVEAQSRHRRHDRLQDRAVYMPYEQSRINSSESLASSWFYQQDQPPILDHCCACDEAKYELVFEGLWSKYTHPEDFPENYWLAYFSDIIGASHSNEFTMWVQNSLASDGVRELAETGATKKLESELKQVSSKTRTIIKARELRYPTLNSKTSAVFRTDKQHHLVSILSKLGPSPDWMVGVSGLELCQIDCTWAAQRVVNLYLWDAGTDSGGSFMASDLPTRPQERIHPYRRAGVSSGGSLASNSRPVDQQQTFSDGGGTYVDGSMMQYDRNQQQQLLPIIDDTNINMSSNQAGSASMTTNMQEQMKPFARLTVTRQRIYEKSCNGAGSNGDLGTPVANRTTNNNAHFNSHSSMNQQQHLNHLHPSLDTIIEPVRPSYSDCRFTDWSDWSSCSSTCGKGIRTRTRSFYDDQAHLTPGCSQSDLIEKEICLADCVGNTSCVTQDWSEWSKCSIGCGQGYRKRTRSPIGHLKSACASVELAEMEQCTGVNCGQADSPDGDQPAPAECQVSGWSQWSECSVACGRGTKIRTRQLIRREDLENCSNVRLLQKQSCTGRPELCKQVAPTSRGANLATQSGQHHNQLEQNHNQKQINLDLPVIDCKLSNWSPWSTCSALCGLGKRIRSRYIIQMPQNGGKPCDKKLSRTQRCKDLPPCPQDFQSGISNGNSGGPVGRNSKSSHNQHQTSGSPSGGGGQYRTTASPTTPGMMDDEDDSKFSRLLKSPEMGHMQLTSAGWTPTESSYISDADMSSSTELELIGSSSFRIVGGNSIKGHNELQQLQQYRTTAAYPARYHTTSMAPDYGYDDEDDRLSSRLPNGGTPGSSNFNFGIRGAGLSMQHMYTSRRVEQRNRPKRSDW